MNFEYEAPFIDPGKSTPAKEEKKKKKRKKKMRVSKYEIDVNNLFSKDFRDKKTYWNLDVFPVDLNGEYITYSRIEFLDIVCKTRRDLSRKIKQLGVKIDYQELIKCVLNKLGCTNYWSRGKIRSMLSKGVQARRKAKKDLELRRKLEEARQAELALGISEKE